MSDTTKTNYCSYNLAEASRCNPDIIASAWDCQRGVYYEISSEEDITYRISTDGKLLLLPVNTVDSYGLIWDHIDLTTVEKSIVDQLRESSDTWHKNISSALACPGNRGLASLNGEEFSKIPREVLIKACALFESHNWDLNEDNLETALKLSYFFTWAKKNQTVA